jgi:hypothetical protein
MNISKTVELGNVSNAFLCLQNQDTPKLLQKLKKKGYIAHLSELSQLMCRQSRFCVWLLSSEQNSKQDLYCWQKSR